MKNFLVIIPTAVHLIFGNSKSNRQVPKTNKSGLSSSRAGQNQLRKRPPAKNWLRADEEEIQMTRNLLKNILTPGYEWKNEKGHACSANI